MSNMHQTKSKDENQTELYKLPCVIAAQPPVGHFHQRFETTHQRFQQN